MNGIDHEKSLQEIAKSIRANTLKMIYKAKTSHIGTCLSIADLLTVLYFHTLKIDPQHFDDPTRDRFILSKGHAAAIIYATLAERGFIKKELLSTYCENNSILLGHVSHYVPGVEFSTGSLGHGLPVACGLALAGKRDNKNYRIFTILSDGEMDEGSNWEAILFAPHHRLDNLTIIIDYNKIQSFGTVKEVLDLDPLKKKLEAFRWNVKEIDGHDINEIKHTFSQLPFEHNKPSAIIAHTIKGKGVSFMENQLSWHYKSPTLTILTFKL